MRNDIIILYYCRLLYIKILIFTFYLFGLIITVVNATEFQLKSIQEDHNFGLDTRPFMQLTLRLRGPKNNN